VPEKKKKAKKAYRWGEGRGGGKIEVCLPRILLQGPGVNSEVGIGGVTHGLKKDRGALVNMCKRPKGTGEVGPLSQSSRGRKKVGGKSGSGTNGSHGHTRTQGWDRADRYRRLKEKTCTGTRSFHPSCGEGTTGRFLRSHAHAGDGGGLSGHLTLFQHSENATSDRGQPKDEDKRIKRKNRKTLIQTKRLPRTRRVGQKSGLTGCNGQRRRQKNPIETDAGLQVKSEKIVHEIVQSAPKNQPSRQRAMRREKTPRRVRRQTEHKKRLLATTSVFPPSWGGLSSSSSKNVDFSTELPERRGFRHSFWKKKKVFLMGSDPQEAGLPWKRRKKKVQKSPL